jgi:hypothetical protein
MRNLSEAHETMIDRWMAAKKMPILVLDFKSRCELLKYRSIPNDPMVRIYTNREGRDICHYMIFDVVNVIGSYYCENDKISNST